MNTNFKVIGLTRLGIKPESTAPEADALTTWPSELLNCDDANASLVTGYGKLKDEKVRGTHKRIENLSF